MSDYTALRAALAAGPTPGPWSACGPSFGAPLPKFLDTVIQPDDADGGIVICQSEPLTCAHGTADMAYIAAADPATIAALLAALDDARRELNQVRDYADALNARCVADTPDAERYRWLRREKIRPIYRPGHPLIEHYIDGQTLAWSSGEHSYSSAIDAAIDAAMKGKP